MNKNPDDSGPGENGPMKILQMIGIITFGFLVIYVGSYYLLVKPGPLRFVVKGGAKPVTLLLPKETGSPILSKLHIGLGFYTPINALDRHLFPNRWNERVTFPHSAPLPPMSPPPASSPLISTNKSP